MKGSPVTEADALLIVSVQGAVFDRDVYVMAGTNVRVGDCVSRFVMGDTVATLAADWEVTTEHIEAAIRTALRARKIYP